MNTGAAFIDCDPVVAEFGRQAYLHADVVSRSDLKQGEVLSFNVHVNKTGMPQVSSTVTWRCIAGKEQAITDIRAFSGGAATAFDAAFDPWGMGAGPWGCGPWGAGPWDMWGGPMSGSAPIVKPRMGKLTPPKA